MMMKLKIGWLVSSIIVVDNRDGDKCDGWYLWCCHWWLQPWFCVLPSRLALAAWVQHLLTVVVSNKGVTEAKTTLLLCSLLPQTKKVESKSRGCQFFWQIKGLWVIIPDDWQKLTKIAPSWSIPQAQRRWYASLFPTVSSAVSSFCRRKQQNSEQ